MGYSDPAAQREYQKAWVRRRRDEFFADKSCVRCGSTENLQLDHKDRAEKVDHKIWSWSKARREAEIAKCQVLCKPCHDEKSAAEVGKHECISRAKLTEDQVLEILARPDKPGTSLAREFGVSRYAISLLRLGKTWKHIPRP